MTKTTKIEIVAVVWRDAHAANEGWAWFDVPNDDGDLIVTSVGLLLPKGHGRKRGHVSIAQSVTDHRAIDSLLHVPKGMVISVTRLAEGRFQDGRFVLVTQRD